MDIEIQEFSFQELSEIVELNKSLELEWFHFSDEGEKTKIPAFYENLSSFERYMHGGPWLDEKALKIYYSTFAETNKVFVAKFKDKIVAEAEITYSNEPNPFGSTIYLTWIMTQPKFQRKGIGRKLLDFCYLKGKEIWQVDYFDTTPEDEISKLTYLNSGFKEFFNIKELVFKNKELIKTSIPDHIKINKYNYDVKNPPLHYYRLLSADLCTRQNWQRIENWRRLISYFANNISQEYFNPIQVVELTFENDIKVLLTNETRPRAWISVPPINFLKNECNLEDLIIVASHLNYKPNKPNSNLIVALPSLYLKEISLKGGNYDDQEDVYLRRGI